VIFLDELPPYLDYSVAVPVGNGNLATVTTAALANLFVAVTEMPNACLVLSDLGGTNDAAGQDTSNQAVSNAVQQLTGESRRIAVPITPVNPNGDELYQILRKCLFSEVASKSAVDGVASAYREALYTRIQDSYPFHPDLREDESIRRSRTNWTCTWSSTTPALTSTPKSAPGWRSGQGSASTLGYVPDDFILIASLSPCSPITRLSF
jgi:hypothetical protein